jgi:hypothetical protein
MPVRFRLPGGEVSGAGRTRQESLRRRLRRKLLTEPACSPGVRSYREPEGDRSQTAWSRRILAIQRHLTAIAAGCGPAAQGRADGTAAALRFP